MTFLDCAPLIFSGREEDKWIAAVVKQLRAVVFAEIPFKIRVIEWISGTYHYVELCSITTFEEFLGSVKEEMDEEPGSPVSVFALYPPRYSLSSKKRLDASNFMTICEEYRRKVTPIPKIYTIAQEDSPSSSPQQAVKPSSDTHSVSSATTNRTGQGDFNERVLARDEHRCVFCSFDDEPLYAAHIFEHKEFNKIPNESKGATLRSYSLPGVNETSNGFTLCWNCHQAFDNYLVCVDPENSTLFVADALQEHEPTKWGPLNGKLIVPIDYSWPPKDLLVYRSEKLRDKQAHRSANLLENPFRCRTCGIGVKSLSGLDKHLGSKKCLRAGMAKYSTPVKGCDVDKEAIS